MYRSEIKNTGKISPTFCHKSNNFVKIWTKRAWNYFLISLVAIWWHIDRKPGWLKTFKLASRSWEVKTRGKVSARTKQIGHCLEVAVISKGKGVEAVQAQF